MRSTALAASLSLLAVLPALSAPIANPAPIVLRVNLPAYRLEVIRGDRPVASYRVAVGTPRSPTAVGRFAITELTWNPWWHPPDHRVAQGERTAPPGPRNPMGRAKLGYGQMRYIHGTANLASIGCAASRSCIRLANDDVLALARAVQLAAAPDAMSPEELEAVIADPSRTRVVVLDPPVLLEVRYELAEVDGDRLLLHPDVYRRIATPRDELVVAALLAAGVERHEIDDKAVARFTMERPETAAEIPVASLVRPH